jgi:hypothetical protein
MPGYDDDDWVGTPPEGRYTRDRADPQHWLRSPAAAVSGGVLFLLVIVVVLLIVLS